MARPRGVLYGVGVNDADYLVQPTVNGRRIVCQFYRTWANMIGRCYGDKYQSNQPTYRGCSVCDEWLLFSNFKRWMETQDWEGKQLDKDLLTIDNKVYSPDTCVFVTQHVNLLISYGKKGSNRLRGVSYQKSASKYSAQTSVMGKKEHIGLFNNEVDAHIAWATRVFEIAKDVADMQDDERVAAALLSRYTKLLENAKLMNIPQ